MVEEILFRVVPVVVAAAGAVLSAGVKGYSNSLKQADSHTESADTDKSVSLFDKRLEEVRHRWRRYSKQGTLNWWCDMLLRANNYVLGGAIASSFVQTNLDPRIIGFLGVLVLISSLFHQTFRPDLSLRGANYLEMQAERLSRKIEDEKHKLDNNLPGTMSETQLIEEMTVGLNRLSELEVAGYRNLPPTKDTQPLTAGVATAIEAKPRSSRQG